MAPKLNLVGEKYGRWTVCEEIPERNKNGLVMYKCRCDCGVERVMMGSKLKRGLSKSCGCWSVELTKVRNKTHGLSKHPLYTVWGNMIDRCTNEKLSCYKNYGGRGITYFKEWEDAPDKFIKWCEDNGWQRGLEVDRRDNNGHYVPDNIRFLTHKEQQRNTRKNVFYTHEGQTKCLSEWAEYLGIKYMAVCSRIRRGWTIHDALFGEPKKDNRKYRPSNVFYTYKGETKILLDWAQQYNIKYNKLQTRLKKLKWSIEKALTTP